jgi:EAL domain-containing protein (putative c-di-GMP-specific phosphodiesterase class I)
LGPWVLGRACENLAGGQSLAGDETESVLRIRLSRLQSADDDLVAGVLAAIEAGGVEPGLLEIAFDTGAVVDELGSAQDNLEVVADIGVRTALCRFGGSPRDLALLTRSAARSVILADTFDGNELPDDPVVARATGQLVGALTEIGATVSVDGVRTEAGAAWWAGIGVHTAQGPLFGVPADLEQLRSAHGQV